MDRVESLQEDIEGSGDFSSYGISHQERREDDVAPPTAVQRVSQDSAPTYAADTVSIEMQDAHSVQRALPFQTASSWAMAQAPAPINEKGSPAPDFPYDTGVVTRSHDLVSRLDPVTQQSTSMGSTAPESAVSQHGSGSGDPIYLELVTIAEAEFLFAK